MKTTVFESKIGYILVTSFDEKLVKLDVSDKYNNHSVEDDFNNFVIFQLKEYFHGERKIFTIPLSFDESSEFNKKVWTELLNIPYGKTASYLEVSEKIGHPKAYRAVGTAVGRNPIPIIVPCHRVISSSGKIGGFSLPIFIKEELLKIEQKDGCKKNF